MSVTKDKKTGKWMSQIRIEDWTGKVIHKKKRGFDTKREALQWERNFIAQSSGSTGMGFKEFTEIYLNDLEQRLKATTIENKRYLIDLKITPFFGSRILEEIKATDVRKWQNTLTSYRDDNGNPYSQTYLKTINNQLTAIFNYAVRYYGLKENPCHKAGSMGKKNADKMSFWTPEEFNRFLEVMKDRPMSYALFMTMYYTGIREGEILALTPEDIDLEQLTIRINKNFQQVKGETLITSPKTPKSTRVITMPVELKKCLEEYMAQCYEMQPTDRLFPVYKSWVVREMLYGEKKAGLKHIRVHDLRHSHASLLIEMGFSPLLVAERLGHERVQTTMEIYSHLYPNKQAEVARQLNDVMLKN